MQALALLVPSRLYMCLRACRMICSSILVHACKMICSSILVHACKMNCSSIHARLIALQSLVACRNPCLLLYTHTLVITPQVTRKIVHAMNVMNDSNVMYVEQIKEGAAIHTPMINFSGTLVNVGIFSVACLVSSPHRLWLKGLWSWRRWLSQETRWSQSSNWGLVSFDVTLKNGYIVTVAQPYSIGTIANLLSSILTILLTCVPIVTHGCAIVTTHF